MLLESSYVKKTRLIIICVIFVKTHLYLKAHVIENIIETFCLGKAPKEQNSNADNVHEGKNQMIVKHSKTVHEEESLCPKCNVNFMTTYCLRIHIEEEQDTLLF